MRAVDDADQNCARGGDAAQASEQLAARVQNKEVAVLCLRHECWRVLPDNEWRMRVLPDNEQRRRVLSDNKRRLLRILPRHESVSGRHRRQ